MINLSDILETIRMIQDECKTFITRFGGDNK